MTQTGPSIGKRIASYRKYLEVGSAADLAARIPNEKITASVIQNIEAGRKADLSVSQLLDISRGLGISPLFLLIPVGRPFDLVDLPNVGDSVNTMTSHAFDLWFSVLESDVPGETGKASNLRLILRYVREMMIAVREWERASMNPDLHAEPVEYEDEHGVVQTHDPAEWAVTSLAHAESRIDHLHAYLSAYNVDLSWLKRPWADKSDG